MASPHQDYSYNYKKLGLCIEGQIYTSVII